MAAPYINSEFLAGEHFFFFGGGGGGGGKGMEFIIKISVSENLDCIVWIANNMEPYYLKLVQFQFRPPTLERFLNVEQYISSTFI